MIFHFYALNKFTKQRFTQRPFQVLTLSSYITKQQRLSLIKRMTSGFLVLLYLFLFKPK